MQHRDLYPALVTCLALFVYAWNFAAAGAARGKYKIAAPATTGHPAFERALRVQQNMLEQLIVFLPSLWIFSLSIDPIAGAVIGLAFVIGRILYAAAYATDPAKRGPGFAIGGLANLILLIGAFVGVIRLFLLDA
jgi:uncharacterized MAPEG superfamily protein